MVKEEEKRTKKTRAKRKKVPKEDKAQVKKKMKIEMIRYCLVWGYNEIQTIAYFKERGEDLSHTHYYELKREFLSDESTKGWYTEQAIAAMEVTHKQSVEQLDELIKTTMVEIQQLQSTPVYIKSGNDIEFNENHNPIALAKMMDTLVKLIATRDDMLAATPVVQAIMNKHNLEREKNMVTT